MKILVIGGAGYIGSHVVFELLQDNHDVYIYDSLYSSHIDNVLVEKEKFIQANILDKEALNNVVKDQDFDAFIHLAALKAAGESMQKIQEYSENNIIGTINILNVAADNGIKNIVFSSSAAVYGNPDYLPIDENHKTEPINYYGFTKLEIERFLSWYSQLKGLNYASLRYFNAVGYNEDGKILGLEKGCANLIPVIMEVIMKKREKLSIFGDDYDTEDGTCIRDYIHVSDLARGHLLALKYIAKENKNLTLNLGVGQGYTVKQIYNKSLEFSKKLIAKDFNINFEISPKRLGDPGILMSSSKRAKELLNWEATSSSIDNIIESTLKVYLKNRELKKI